MKKFLIPAVLFFAVFSLQADIIVKNGENIAFLGDSITYWGGTQNPYYGYIHLVLDGLRKIYLKNVK